MFPSIFFIAKVRYERGHYVIEISCVIPGIRYLNAVNRELGPDKGGMHTSVQRVRIQKQTDGVALPALAHRQGGMDDILDELCFPRC